MTDAQLWALILGFLATPQAVAVINQPTWSRPARAAVMTAVSLLVGFGTAYFTGQFTGRSVLSCVLITAVAAVAAYKGLFKPIGLAPALERATSPKTGPRGV